MKKKIDIDLSLGTKNAQNSLNSLKDNFTKLSKDMAKNFDKSFNQGALKNAITCSNQLAASMSGVKAAANEANGAIEGIAGSIAGIISGKKSTKETIFDLIKNVVAPQQNSPGIMGSLFSGLGFDTGGIVPGSFSQAVPVMAHGSEMILNPGQQANLFKQLNGGGSAAAQTPNYIYAPQIKTGASASEVFDVLQRHSRQFFSMVAEGVSSNNNLRRGA